MKTDTRAEGSVLLKAANGDKKDPSQPMTVVSGTAHWKTANTACNS